MLGPPRKLPFAAGWDWDYRACVSGDGRFLAVADPTRDQVTITDLGCPDRQVLIDNCPGVISLALSIDGRYLATGHDKQGLDVWETATGQPLPGSKEKLGDSDSASVSFSPNGQWFATSIRGACSLWRVGSWTEGPIAVGKRSDVWTAPPAFSPDGQIMAAVNAAQIITLYDVARGKELVSLTPAEPQGLCAPCFSPDGGQLAVGVEDHTIQIWDLRRIRQELRDLGLDWDPPPYPLEKRATVEMSPLLVAYGLVEAECLEVIDHQHCDYSVEDMRPHRPKQWSSRKQLSCRAEPGGFVELELPVAMAGRHRLEVGFTKGPNFGRVQLHVDGAPIGDVVDTFDPDIGPMGMTSLGAAELRPGAHRIRFTAAGKNPQATACDMGIDCLKLSPLDAASSE